MPSSYWNRNPPVEKSCHLAAVFPVRSPAAPPLVSLRVPLREYSQPLAPPYPPLFWQNDPMSSSFTPLSTAAVRILGALVEKEATTPEYYPLSLNALGNACNQKNNREPVMALDEDDLRRGVHELEDRRLAGLARDGGRVAKYTHSLGEVFNVTRGESAVLCVLLLRGPQTPGELRSRTERIYPFEEIADVQAVIHKLMAHEPALVKALPRQHGMKEIRYTHLLAGDIEAPELFPQAVPSSPQDDPWFSPQSRSSAPADSAARSRAVVPYEKPVAPILSEEDLDLQERVTQLEAEVAVVSRELAELKAQIAKVLKRGE